MTLTYKLEGLEETVRSLGELSRATQRNVLRRVLNGAAQPVADRASQLAPEASGLLAFSITVSPNLTPRQRRRAQRSWVEVHIGPAAGTSTFYASFREFGTVLLSAHPFMRPAWDSLRMPTLERIKVELRQEVMRATARAARRAARIAAR